MELVFFKGDEPGGVSGGTTACRSQRQQWLCQNCRGHGCFEKLLAGGIQLESSRSNCDVANLVTTTKKT